MSSALLLSASLLYPSLALSSPFVSPLVLLPLLSFYPPNLSVAVPSTVFFSSSSLRVLVFESIKKNKDSKVKYKF